MNAIFRDYWALLIVAVYLGWFVCSFIVSDLPDDILSKLYKRLKDHGKEGADGGVRDNR